MTFSLTFRDPMHETMIAERVMAALDRDRAPRPARAQTAAKDDLEPRVAKLEETAEDHESRIRALEPADGVRRASTPRTTIKTTAPAPALKARPKPAQKAKARMATTTTKPKDRPRSELEPAAREALLRQLPTELADVARRTADDKLLHELVRSNGSPMPSAMAMRMGTVALERVTLHERGVTRLGVLMPKATSAARKARASAKPSRPARLPADQKRAMDARMGLLEQERVTVQRGAHTSFGVPVTPAERAAGRTVDGGRIVDGAT